MALSTKIPRGRSVKTGWALRDTNIIEEKYK
jgi:hypothetical protein